MKIGIVGAGHIGLYLGARLIQAGAEVVFLGRKRMHDHLIQHGLKVNSIQGGYFSAKDFTYVFRASDFPHVDVIFNTLKTTQTRQAFEELSPYLGPQVTIVNLQNGVETGPLFSPLHQSHRIVDGMVTFNVVINSLGEFYQSTSGPLVIDQSVGESVLSLCRNLKIEFTSTANIEGIKWSKLLLNLNNSLNALAGIPLKQELEGRVYRKILAKLMLETLAVTRAKGIKLEKLTPLPPGMIPLILRLPNPLFKIIARRMISIDPTAKSSMLMDLENRVPTEIDFLNLKVCDFGKRLGIETRFNLKVSALIKAAEEKNQGSPCLDAETIWKELTSSP